MVKSEKYNLNLTKENGLNSIESDNPHICLAPAINQLARNEQ